MSALDLGRALPKKTCIFFLPSARIRLLQISEKNQLILGDEKKHFEKTCLFQEIKNIVPVMFLLCLFFFVALTNFFLNR